MPIGNGPALSPLKKKSEQPSVVNPHSKAWDCGMLGPLHKYPDIFLRYLEVSKIHVFRKC